MGKLSKGGIFFLLLAVLAVREAVAGPRHRVKVGHNQDWGVRMDSDLELDTGHGRGPDVQHLLREHDSPAMRSLMSDPLFLRHLELFLERPSQKTFHELKSRAKTLRRRRTDEVSTRFFLRD